MLSRARAETPSTSDRPSRAAGQQAHPRGRESERPRLRKRERRLQELVPDPGRAAADDYRLGVEDVDVVGEPDAEVVGRRAEDLQGCRIAGVGRLVDLGSRQVAGRLGQAQQAGERPAATASLAIRAMAVPEASTSRQPTMPQLWAGR